MFSARDLTLIESWRLKNDLNLDDFSGFWLSHAHNIEFLESVERALLQQIQGSAEFRAIFLTDKEHENKIFSSQAIAIYETHAQDFLKRLLIFCHIAPGPLLRAPELLSVT